MRETTRPVRKFRGARTVARSRLSALSGGGRNDPGKARSYRCPRLKPSDDQSGLVTLEWIILIAAVSGIVTLALLAGWNALWNRSDALSDEGGSGHQLAANRAAAEASSGRACSLLNDLYSYDFKYVPVAAGSTGCTCEIDSEATASQVCDVETVENAGITIGLKQGGTARTIDVSQLFFSENSADLSYTILRIPDTNLASAAITPPNSASLVLTPASGSTARPGNTSITVQARDSHTNSTETVGISVQVESNCILSSELPPSLPSSHGSIPNLATASALSRTSIWILNKYFLTPLPSIRSTVSNSDIVELGQTELDGQIILSLYFKRPGLTKLTLVPTYCNGDTRQFEVNLVSGRDAFITTPFTPQTYSTSPQIIDLASHFDESQFHGGVSYRATSGREDVATVSVNGSNLTITKVASGRTDINVYAVSNDAEDGFGFTATFS